MFRPLELELLMQINEAIGVIDKMAIGFYTEGEIAWQIIRKELVEGRKTPDNSQSDAIKPCSKSYRCWHLQHSNLCHMATCPKYEPA